MRPFSYHESRPRFNSNQSFLFGAKVETLAPRFSTLGVKGAIENIFSVCPKLLIN
jgi:hypothetical protein